MAEMGWKWVPVEFSVFPKSKKKFFQRHRREQFFSRWEVVAKCGEEVLGWGLGSAHRQLFLRRKAGKSRGKRKQCKKVKRRTNVNQDRKSYIVLWSNKLGAIEQHARFLSERQFSDGRGKKKPKRALLWFIPFRENQKLAEGSFFVSLNRWRGRGRRYLWRMLWPDFEVVLYCPQNQVGGPTHWVVHLRVD